MIEVQDFIKTLKLLELLSKRPFGMDPSMTSFIKKLRMILTPYKELEEDEFFESLKDSLSTHRINKTKKERKVTSLDIDFDNITFEELRTLFSKKSLNKEQLLDIGEHRFGISRGANLRLKKEHLQDLIETAMQNIETLHIIRDSASE